MNDEYEEYLDDSDFSEGRSKEWERRLLSRNRVWWISGVSLFALTVGAWNYFTIRNLEEEIRNDRNRSEVRDVLEGLERIDGEGKGIESFLAGRKELTFHDIDARREPVLLKRFFKRRDKVKYDSVEYEVSEVLSVAYSPDNRRGAVLFDLGSVISDYDIVIFNTGNDLNQKVIEAPGQTISEVSWEDNDTLVYKSKFFNDSFPKYLEAKINKNNIVEELSELNRK